MFASAWAGVAFGSVFEVVGILLVLMGTRMIPIDPASLHGPYWLLTVIGGCFAAAGLAVQIKSLVQSRRAALCKRMQRRYPDQPWKWDYPWDPHGFAPSRWKPVFGRMVSTLFIGAFAVPFNWVGFYAQAKILWPFAIFAGIMDLATMSLLGYTGYLFLKTLKFGATAVYWPHFPLKLGESCEIQWQAPKVRLDPRGLKATLRLVEEYFVVRGSGKHRSRHQVFDCLYETAIKMKCYNTGSGQRRCSMDFTLPSALPSTHLSADVEGQSPPRYYLLTIVCIQKGIDFKEHYLLPLYR